MIWIILILFMFNHWVKSNKKFMLVSINKNRSPNFMPVCMLNSLQSRLMLWDSMDCSPPCSSDHGILQARRLEWVAMSTSRRPSQPRDRTLISCLLHWQADSLPLAPLRKPPNFIEETTQVLIVFSMKIYYLDIPLFIY